METRTRIVIMKILSLTGVFTFVYPVIYVFRKLLFSTGGGFGSFAFFIGFLYAGFLAGLLIVREESAFFQKIAQFPLIDIFFEGKAKARNISAFAAYLTLVVPLACSFIAYRHEGIFRLLMEVPLACLIYFTGLRGYFMEYGRILSKQVMYTGAIIILFPVFTAYFNTSLNARPFVVGCAYAFMVISMIVRNQDTLDTLFLKKGVNMYDTVKRVRGFNVLIVIGIFLLALILFNFNDTVVVALNGMLYILKRIAAFIIMLMMANPEPEFKGGNMPPPPDQLPFANEEVLIRPWSNFISNVLTYFVVMFLAYKLAFLLISKSRQIFSGIAALIRKLLNVVFPSYNKLETEDYSDEIETVKPEKMISKVRLRPRIRAIRKNLRQISDPVEKIRYIYGAVLSMFAMKNIEISASDTTGEILRKVAHVEGVMDCFSEMTGIYEKIRYGDMLPKENDVQSFENGYDRMKKVLK